MLVGEEQVNILIVKINFINKERRIFMVLTKGKGAMSNPKSRKRRKIKEHKDYFSCLVPWWNYSSKSK